MFKRKPKNIMTSIGVWAYVIITTLLGFIYSYQHSDIQATVKEYSNLITLVMIACLILLILQSQFIHVSNRFREKDYNKIYSYQDLNRFKDVIPIIAILGLSKTGKTTLIDSIFYKKPLNQRTQNIGGRLKNIEDNRNVLFYDMSGESNIQINDVMQYADCIIFMLDHNESNCETSIDEKRINANIKLIEDLCSSYNEKEYRKKIPTLFLINKFDLSREYDLYEMFYKKEINNWKHVFGSTLEHMPYSNKYISEAIDNKFDVRYELEDIMKFIKGNAYEK
ncbi:Uncharacterised protein [Serratia fonticola]|uniref:GTPase domain-containing protein n=1 Tax=Serratia fonticola TaxID=47917 RepID=UPI00217A11D1|nr:GTPase domain-containing protein [Serratia fonticola]CAI1920179.1 Uncharacterised protein [Serratia fonticola]